MFRCCMLGCENAPPGRSLRDTLEGQGIIGIVRAVEEARRQGQYKLNRFWQKNERFFSLAAGRCYHRNQYHLQQLGVLIPFGCHDKQCNEQFIQECLFGPRSLYWEISTSYLDHIWTEYRSRIETIFNSVIEMNWWKVLPTAEFTRVNFFYEEVNYDLVEVSVNTRRNYNGTLAELLHAIRVEENFDFQLQEDMPWSCHLHFEENLAIRPPTHRRLSYGRV